MSRTASNYNIPRLCVGLFITGIAALLVFPSTYAECARNRSSGGFLGLMIITYGLMMFASSYVEEEQQFWYWICSGWIFYLHIKSESTRLNPHKRAQSLSFMSQNGITIVFAISQRLLRRWNQTGQKFAAEPDIARTFFSHNPDVFWGLLILAYADAGVHLLRKLQVSGLPKLGALLLAVVAFTFKLHFVASESPELLDGTFVLKLVEKWPYSLSLVLHARIVFYGIGVVVLLALLTKMSSRAARSKLCEPQMPREFGLT